MRLIFLFSNQWVSWIERRGKH